MSLKPTIFINQRSIPLDIEHYRQASKGRTDRIKLDGRHEDLWCDGIGCGDLIHVSGYIEGRATIRTETGYDSCSVVCRSCEQGYPVVWKEIALMPVKIIVFKQFEGRPTVLEVETPWRFTKELLADDHDKDPTIQIVTLDDGVEIYCDEDALGKGLLLNRCVPATARPLPSGFTMENVVGWDPSMAKPGELGEHHIHGSFILCRHDHDKDEPMSLTDEDIAKWLFTLWKKTPDPVESAG